MESEKIVALEPILVNAYDHDLESDAGELADQTEKRVGGGRAQFGLMTFSEIADTIVLHAKGYDKQHGRKYEGKEFVLERYLKEYGIPLFGSATVIAGFRKFVQDPEDGFIPLAPGTIDIEAGLQPEGPSAHRELQIYGIPKEKSADFETVLAGRIGFATEYTNKDSLEIVVPMYTHGEWKKIEDIEFGKRATGGRQTGMAIVTPYSALWCEGLLINSLYNMPDYASVKMQEAVKIAQQIGKEIGLK